MPDHFEPDDPNYDPDEHTGPLVEVAEGGGGKKKIAPSANAE